MRLYILLLLPIFVGCGSIYDPRTEFDGETDNRLIAYMASEGKLSPDVDLGKTRLYYRSGQDRSIAWQRDDAYDAETGNIIQDFGDFAYGTSSEVAAQMRNSDNQRYVAMGQQWQQGVTQTVGSLVQLAAAMNGGSVGGGLSPENLKVLRGQLGLPEPAPEAPASSVTPEMVADITEALRSLSARLDALEASPEPEPPGE